MNVEREAFVESFRACWRAALASAYARQVLRGINLSQMAYRLGCDPEVVERQMFVPADLGTRDMADLCWAMDCEPVFSLEDGRIRIEVVPNDPAQSE